MDEILTMFHAGQAEFSTRVEAVGEGQWGASTPDSEWSVADLVAHLVDEHLWLPPLLRGLDLDSAAKVVAGARSLPVDGGVGSNLAESWAEAATGASVTVNEPGVLEREVALSRGATPVPDYLTEMVFDLVVHSWDLGTAIDFAEPLPTGLVEWAYGCAQELGDLSSSGVFHAPVPVPDDAPTIAKLVALTGREPR